MGPVERGQTNKGRERTVEWRNMQILFFGKLKSDTWIFVDEKLPVLVCEKIRICCGSTEVHHYLMRELGDFFPSRCLWVTNMLGWKMPRHKGISCTGSGFKIVIVVTQILSTEDREQNSFDCLKLDKLKKHSETKQSNFQSTKYHSIEIYGWPDYFKIAFNKTGGSTLTNFLFHEYSYNEPGHINK